MSTVLVVEDQFLASYELECVLKERGYDVRHAATQSDAIREFHRFKVEGISRPSCATTD
jgi:DNA-binding response OmpR family regulator